MTDCLQGNVTVYKEVWRTFTLFTRKCGFYEEVWLTFYKEVWLTFYTDFLQGNVAAVLRGNVADF